MRWFKMNKNNYWFKSEKILKLFPKKSFISSNCGFNSTERRNLKRVADVVEALHSLNNWNLKRESTEFFDMIRMSIIDYMKECGFKHSINSRDKTQFKKVKE